VRERDHVGQEGIKQVGFPCWRRAHSVIGSRCRVAELREIVLPAGEGPKGQGDEGLLVPRQRCYCGGGSVFIPLALHASASIEGS
jgi:hypothetical protein